MKHWEYISWPCDGSFDRDRKFTELGANGWELVAVTTETPENFACAYFKREIATPQSTLTR